MSFDDHTCEECGHWDDINGCWAGGPGCGPLDIVCHMYSGFDCDDEEENDLYDDAVTSES